MFPNYYGRLQKIHDGELFKSYGIYLLMKKLIKQEAEKEIKTFFEDIKNKKQREIKKIKRLAMKHNIKLGSLRKKFCKRCFSPRLKIKSIKNKIKITECQQCKNVSRLKLR